MPQARYRFEKEALPTRFRSEGGVSTDALNALTKWSQEVDDRKFEVVTDEEQMLRADISWPQNDEKAGADLDTYCEQYGVTGIFEPPE